MASTGIVATITPRKSTRVAGRDRYQLRETLAGYGLVLPAGVLYAAFQIFPILFAFVLSFFDWDGLNLSQAQFIGIGNYTELFTDPLFWSSVLHNLFVALGVVVVQCFGSFLLAAIITAGIKGGRFFQLVFFAPMVISTIAVGMLAIFIFSPSQGLLNAILRAVGLGAWAQPWLGSATWALPTVIVTMMLQGFGLSF
ncbi:hypothetical protein GCM10025867_02200 [Frondihabitans sucicola]|uniref:Sugar ABC transporter permease n=1 Tax=Frondihabitans sucicola TaxID=1268041 RepID=A0ABM8GHZ1_9MICO|nr:sugar ABC transporter permease [Frondihabitans sucicola]BDZ47979.1 hypothetical protein GCM10025867_02200 [Frondihabitans sucicola]